MVSVTEIAMTPNSNPVYNLGIAYRSHVGFGSSAMFSANNTPATVINHARISSARMTKGKGLLSHQNVALSGAGQAQPSDDELATLFDTPMSPQETLLAIDKRETEQTLAGSPFGQSTNGFWSSSNGTEPYPVACAR